jgi:hypothetical protein
MSYLCARIHHMAAAARPKDEGRISLDFSACSVVAVCGCGWREVTAGRPAARLAAAAHLRTTHKNAQRAHDLIRRRP